MTGLRHQAARQAHAIAQQLRRRGDDYLDGQKQRAAETLSEVGAAVRRAAEKLHDSRSNGLAQYVDSAADGIDGIASYIEQQDLSQLTTEIGRTLRRHPGIVLGAMFLAGMGAARFAKATSPARAAALKRKR
jgi:hypothetical protein